jgi:sporulation protein YlmC with PRC-barrel domain
MLTNLHMGAKVTGFNNEHLGSVKYLVADPNNDLVTHLVVHEAGSGSRDILVENGRLNHISDDGGTVNLNLSRPQLAELPDFVEREFVTNEIADGSANFAPIHNNFGDNPVPVETNFFGTTNNSTYVNTGTLDPLNPTITNGAGLGLTGTSNGLFGNAIGPVGAPVEERLNVPEDSLIIREGASVEALDGHIGKVKEVNIDPENGQVTSFVVKRGLFILDDYTVPVQAVESSTQDEVFVKLTKADFKNAPLAEEVEPANYAPAEKVAETVEANPQDTEDSTTETVNATTHPAARA